MLPDFVLDCSEHFVHFNLVIIFRSDLFPSSGYSSGRHV
jgi:hypothetical protein